MEFVDPLLANDWFPTGMYILLLLAAWGGVLAILLPGSGVLEVTAGLGLLIGLGGVLVSGGNVAGLGVLAASFGLYALAAYRNFMDLDLEQKPKPPEQLTGVLAGTAPLTIAFAATVLQVVGGLVLFAGVLGASVWVVIVLALASLAIYLWLLTPIILALRPPPQSGSETLIGALAEVREVPAQPGKPYMVFLQGELWQAQSAEVLAVGERVQVTGREGLRLFVEKMVP